MPARYSAAPGSEHPSAHQVELAAGNISSIAPLDVLYKLYADGDVVVVKMNPVIAALEPVLERVFAPYVQQGFVRFASGGADVGGYLAHHPQVGAVHMTGSAAVHDAIVFGDGALGAARRAEGRPLIDKPITKRAAPSRHLRIRAAGVTPPARGSPPASDPETYCRSSFLALL